MAAVLGYPLFVGGILFFLLALRNGVALARGRPGAVPGALAIQGVHSVWFAVRGGLHVQIASGPTLGVVISDAAVRFSAGFNASFFLGTRIAGPAWEVGFNVVAMVWTVVLLRAWVAQTPAAASVNAS